MSTQREAWLSQVTEEAIDPALPICDPHHHFWDREGDCYLLDQLTQDVGGGHNIAQTVFIECHSMYRARGPEEMRAIGETEFVQGLAAQSASGQYGPTEVAAGIVANADLMLGDRGCAGAGGARSRQQQPVPRDPVLLLLGRQPRGFAGTVHHGRDAGRRGFPRRVRPVAAHGPEFRRAGVPPAVAGTGRPGRSVPELDHHSEPRGSAFGSRAVCRPTGRGVRRLAERASRRLRPTTTWWSSSVGSAT